MYERERERETEGGKEREIGRDGVKGEEIKRTFYVQCILHNPLYFLL